MPSSYSGPCRVQGFPPPNKIKCKNNAKENNTDQGNQKISLINESNSFGIKRLRMEGAKNYTLPIRALTAGATIQARRYKLPLLTKGMNSSLKSNVFLFCPGLVNYVRIKTSLITNKTLERSPVSTQSSCNVNPVVQSLFLNNKYKFCFLLSSPGLTINQWIITV